MEYTFVGLGNPGEEYKNSRHNTGRIVLEYVGKRNNFPAFEKDKKLNALVSCGKFGKKKVRMILPETFMNKSGVSVKKLITSVKKAERLVVVYDDLDLPLGTFKISFGRGSGGHNGLDSVAKHVQTKNFIRVRVGVSPAVRGKSLVRKPKGEDKVLDFIMGPFTKKEHEMVEHVSRDISNALEVIVTEGKDRAMNTFN